VAEQHSPFEVVVEINIMQAKPLLIAIFLRHNTTVVVVVIMTKVVTGVVVR